MSLPTMRELATQVASGEHYVVRELHRRDGRVRRLFVPDPWLAMALKKSAEILLSLNPPFADHVHGFVKRRNIVGNARPHLAKQVVLRIDLEDFFPSITSDQVLHALSELGLSDEGAQLVASLATVNGRLPIGFHTSPVISNMVFRSTDAELADLAAARGLKLTRYVDDITFSGRIEPAFVEDARELLLRNGWKMNDRKTRLMKKGGKQFVTGLSVADPTRPRLPIGLKKRMRWKAHMIQKVGFETYLGAFHGEALGETPRQLIGMAKHMASVEPAVGLKLLAILTTAAEQYWEDQGEFWHLQDDY
jgi:RNA-directed DNA polymerase